MERVGSSGANPARAQLLSLPSTRPRAATIPLTNSPSPWLRHTRRNAVLVMPAIGASTTGGDTSSGPMRSAGTTAVASAIGAPGSAGAVVLTRPAWLVAVVTVQRDGWSIPAF